MTTKPMITVTDLHKTFGEHIHAVRGVSLSVATGEVVVIVGVTRISDGVAISVSGGRYSLRDRQYVGLCVTSGDKCQLPYPHTNSRKVLRSLVFEDII